MTLITFDEKYYELQFPESILDWSSSSKNLKVTFFLLEGIICTAKVIYNYNYI